LKFPGLHSVHCVFVGCPFVAQVSSLSTLGAQTWGVCICFAFTRDPASSSFRFPAPVPPVMPSGCSRRASQRVSQFQLLRRFPFFVVSQGFFVRIRSHGPVCFDRRPFRRRSLRMRTATTVAVQKRILTRCAVDIPPYLFLTFSDRDISAIACVRSPTADLLRRLPRYVEVFF